MKKSLILALSLVLFASCKQDWPAPEAETTTTTEAAALMQRNEFARILSRAVYEREDLRQFLKQEATERFDQNSDVLYAAVCNAQIGSETLRDILLSYTSEEELTRMEQALPQLNILSPEIALFDITPENWDVADPEVPVAVANGSSATLYLNGEACMELAGGEVPGFHVLVVNDNSRVIVNQPAGRTSARSNAPGRNNSVYTLLYPEAVMVSGGGARQKAIDLNKRPSNLAMEAYEHFHGRGNDSTQMGFQREYIYYGMTPEKQHGTHRDSVSEYISYIKVNPTAYFRLSAAQDDPKIANGQVSSKKHALTEAELIERMWTQGMYTFRFEFCRLSEQNPTEVLISATPADLWNFNIKSEYKKATLFRHSKYTYTINPRNFTAKRFDLANKVRIPGWDLAQEGISRRVFVFEEQRWKQNPQNVHFSDTFSKIDETLFNGATEKVALDCNHEQLAQVSQEFSMQTYPEDILLGSLMVYYYDPFVKSVRQHHKLMFDLNSYDLHTYNTGTVEFALMAE